VLQEERGRLMRRNIVRYSMLSYVITLQHVSLRVKQRFPSWQHMVDAGELFLFCSVQRNFIWCVRRLAKYTIYDALLKRHVCAFWPPSLLFTSAVLKHLRSKNALIGTPCKNSYVNGF
jgi:Bestrophin, RFP-TM, chloride channel